MMGTVWLPERKTFDYTEDFRYNVPSKSVFQARRKVPHPCEIHKARYCPQSPSFVAVKSAAVLIDVYDLKLAEEVIEEVEDEDGEKDGDHDDGNVDNGAKASKRGGNGLKSTSGSINAKISNNINNNNDKDKKNNHNDNNSNNAKNNKRNNNKSKQKVAPKARILTLQGHSAAGWGLAWNTLDPGLIISGSDDCRICQWNIDCKLLGIEGGKMIVIYYHYCYYYY